MQGHNRPPECETSSSGEARKRGHSWRSAHSRAHRYDLPENPPFDSVRLSSEALSFPRDLNISLNEDPEDEDDDNDDDDVRVIAAPNDENRQDTSFDGRRLSFKRKTLEAGPSSEAESSSLYQDNERAQRDSSTYPQIVAANPRLHLGVEGPMSSSTTLSSNLSGALESSWRSSQSSRVLLSQRNSQSRWDGASTSRAHGSESDDEDPIATGEIIPVTGLIPCNETGGSSSSQQPAEGTSAGGSNSDVRNVRISSSWSGSSGARPMYRHRLSELVRRSRLSSASNGSNSNDVARSSRSGFSGRYIENVFASPHSSRSEGASSGEGRSSLISEEIRHVLDIMRRGEGLSFEDVMLLENSIFFNMANANDRHRDMRMDVDNMSYEELLALGERIGNVCTGLKEETITKRLKQTKHVGARPQRDAETACCICREEYTEGENIGKLDCGHDFHRDCIKQWLMQKNLCPICKTTGLILKKSDENECCSTI